MTEKEYDDLLTALNDANTDGDPDYDEYYEEYYEPIEEIWNEQEEVKRLDYLEHDLLGKADDSNDEFDECFILFHSDYGTDVYTFTDSVKARAEMPVLTDDMKGRLVTALRWLNFPTDTIDSILTAYNMAHQLVDNKEALENYKDHNEELQWYSSEYDK